MYVENPGADNWLYSSLIPNASHMLSGGLLFCGLPLFLHSAEAPGKEGDGCYQGELHLIFSKCSRQSSTENKQILWAEAQLKTRQSINWRRDSVLSRGVQIASRTSRELFWELESQPWNILPLISLLPLYSNAKCQGLSQFCVSGPPCMAMYDWAVSSVK